ncbi:MAG: hypothetical protein ACRDR6_04910 [Pseudonocardiaceae bacterium]
MSWYLRSLGDRDTHRAGLLHPDGTVTAACGIRFRPPEFLRGTTALRGEPPDPAQICPACDTRRKDDAR